VKRVAAALVIVAALLACGKEEWNRNQLGVSNPYGADTDETEPEEASEDAATDSATEPTDAGGDAKDARPADARADARDATAG
jgi:hypothetical protein